MSGCADFFISSALHAAGCSCKKVPKLSPYVYICVCVNVVVCTIDLFCCYERNKTELTKLGNIIKKQIKLYKKKTMHTKFVVINKYFNLKLI